jgi:hypothetical protein
VNRTCIELCHHGILGQKWGTKNGPPYPLVGGTYDNRNAVEKREGKKEKIKRHQDRVIKSGTKLQTLSVDPNRTKDTDMYYAAFDKRDVHEYNALFNKKMEQPIYDKDGNIVGSEKVHKFRITNIPNKDIKIASETSGANAFMELYKKDRDFYNFVTDESRMQAKFDPSRYRFKGYRESRDVLDKIRNDPNFVPNKTDMQTVYRMFNYTIPNLDNDTVKQRNKLFTELKKQGYAGLLDTNDALYGGFKAEYPVIIIDQSGFLDPSAMRTKASDVAVSKTAFVFIKAMQKA